MAQSPSPLKKTPHHARESDCGTATISITPWAERLDGARRLPPPPHAHVHPRHVPHPRHRVPAKQRQRRRHSGATAARGSGAPGAASWVATAALFRRAFGGRGGCAWGLDWQGERWTSEACTCGGGSTRQGSKHRRRASGIGRGLRRTSPTCSTATTSSSARRTTTRRGWPTGSWSYRWLTSSTSRPPPCQSEPEARSERGGVTTSRRGAGWNNASDRRARALGTLGGRSWGGATHERSVEGLGRLRLLEGESLGRLRRLGEVLGVPLQISVVRGGSARDAHGDEQGLGEHGDFGCLSRLKLRFSLFASLVFYWR